MGQGQKKKANHKVLTEDVIEALPLFIMVALIVFGLVMAHFYNW